MIPLTRWATQRLPAPLRGVIYQQNLAHRRLFAAFWLIWAILGVVLPLFQHPLEILVLGAVFALITGTACGGMDVFQGSQEFTLALPPTRSELHLARLLLPGAHLALLLLAGLGAIACDVPQRLWGLIVTSGFTEPFPPAPAISYVFAFLGPLALFASTHLMASLATSRAAAVAAPLFAAVLILLVLAGSAILEHLVWLKVRGLVAVPALIAVVVASIAIAHHSAVRKEGVSLPESAQRSRAGTIILIVLVVVALLLLLTGLATSA